MRRRFTGLFGMSRRRQDVGRSRFSRFARGALLPALVMFGWRNRDRIRGWLSRRSASGGVPAGGV